MQETLRDRFGKIPWRREWLPTPVFLPENPTDRGATGYSSQGRKELDRLEQLSTPAHGDKRKGHYFSREWCSDFSGTYLLGQGVHVISFRMDMTVPRTTSVDAPLCPLAQLCGKWCFCQDGATLTPGCLEGVILFRLFT